MTALNGFLALGVLDAAGVLFTELRASGYARQGVQLEPDGADDVRNVNAVAFPPAAADWPAFNAYAIWSEAAGGEQLMAWAVKQERLVKGRDHRVMIGDIRLRFPIPRSNFGSPLIMSGPFVRSPQQLFAQLHVVSISQDDYDALETPDPYTLYVIPEEA